MSQDNPTGDPPKRKTLDEMTLEEMYELEQKYGCQIGSRAPVFSLETVEQLKLENEKLRDAIIAHRSQRADDRCVEDDDRLYEALGDGIKCDRRVGSKEDMLANCKRFIERRCEGGHWPSYRELENQLIEYRLTLRAAEHALQSYKYGNSSPDLADQMIKHIEDLLKQ